MSQVEINERHFQESGIVARAIPPMGWGLFADKDFQPGEVIYKLNCSDPRAPMTPFADAFGDCYDRGITIVPGFVFCTSIEHPLWFTNHSCAGNCGFVNWGRIDDNAMTCAAYRPIHAGEQITLEYAYITPKYDGSVNGDPWSMSPCLCGEPNCRGTIGDYHTLPLDMQVPPILGPGEPHGRIIAHILNDEPHLVEMLKIQRPAWYSEFLEALQQQQAMSDHLKLTTKANGHVGK